MNTSIKCLAVACAALLSAACVKTELEPQANDAAGVEITITAVREGYDPDTRTVRESDGSVEWSPKDQISVFYCDANNGGSKFTSQNTEQTAIAEFKGKLEGFMAGGEEFTNGKYLYGVYPYSTNTSFSNGVTTISLPAFQKAAEGTFANELFPTIARSKGVNLAFYNICGGIKFSVSRNDISSIIFKGNNDERLAGTVKVIFDENEKPVVLDNEIESKAEITVYAPNGGTFEVGKEYYIVAYPGNLDSGFSIIFRTSEMKEGTYISNTPVEIKRSVFGVLDQVDENISSWTDITSGDGSDNSGIYLGVIGFNQDLTKFPMKLLTEESKQSYYGFIDSFNYNYDGTALYYAVDQAISSLQSSYYPADLSSVHVVTFTDGIDNYSLDIYDEIEFGKYSSPDEVGDYVKTRLTTEKVYGFNITGYAVGSKHSDVNSTRFSTTLNRIATNSNFVYELTDMAAVETKFKEIAKNITEVNKTQNITVSIAGGLKDGERIRFTFDLPSTSTSPTSSNLYIEGTFERTSTTTRTIKITTQPKGLTMEGTDIVGIKNSDTGLFDFTFKDVATNNKVLIDTKKTLEWWGNPWQKDTEFNPEVNTKIEVINHSAAIILVLDCTKSLGSKFSQMKSSAKSFIATLLQNYNGGNNTPTGGIKTFTANGVSFNMVPVQGGTFQMGATAEQSNGYSPDSDERPVHSVTLNNYYIGETEVTQALWYAVMGSKPSSSYSWSSSYGLGDNYPAYYISYDECKTFITRLNNLTGANFRMPTEAEWEYAARGGNESKGYIFSGSNTIGDVAWFDYNSGSKTHPVATKQANELGIYDMSGNVWEWCNDWYGSYSSNSQTNPTGPSSGSSRVYRGGSWGLSAARCRVAIRGNYSPGSHGNGLGLRLAL